MKIGCGPKTLAILGVVLGLFGGLGLVSELAGMTQVESIRLLCQKEWGMIVSAAVLIAGTLLFCTAVLLEALAEHFAPRQPDELPPAVPSSMPPPIPRAQPLPRRP